MAKVAPLEFVGRSMITLLILLSSLFSPLLLQTVNAAPNDNSDDVYVALSGGSRFVGTAIQWNNNFCTGQNVCTVGDVNGDGKDDIVAFVRTSNGPDDSDVYVALSDGTKFGAPQKWQDYFCTLEEICAVGDVNGDGKDDIITFVRTSGRGNDDDVYIALSDGTKFGEGQKWQDYFCTLQEICKVGDVNGDGKADIITFVRTSNRGNDDDVYVALSNGATFGEGQKWQDYFCTLEEICAVGDVNGDGKDDIITFVRTSNRGNDDDVYVALSNGATFGEGQKWHDYFCTLQEICKVGDANGDGKADAIVFTRTRADYAANARTIDLTLSLYNTPADRNPYIGIVEHFADAIYEMSNGAHRIGKVTIFQNGQHSDTADVVWVSNVWPNVPPGCISGRGRSGCRVNFGDTFPFTTSYAATQPAKWRGAGFTLGHEWGHYYYGLYDEYKGSVACSDKPTNIFDLQTCDSMPNSVMQDQWSALVSDNYNWLNFGISANQTKHNVNWRVYGASGWEVLARSPNLDPRDGQRRNASNRTYYPELAAVAPTGNSASAIELPTSNARGVLQIDWVAPAATSQAVTTGSANGYTPVLRLANGDSILYPEAAVLVATLSKDGGFVTKAGVTAIVTAPDSTTSTLSFNDDGIAPDSEANDGLYAASWLYGQNGQHSITVEFTNGSGAAELTFQGNHYTPGPEGEEYQPAPTPIAEDFSEQVDLAIQVNGYPPEIGAPQPATQVTTDNLDFPGRIDTAGDKDTFTFAAAQAGELVVRVTDLDLGMQPHIQIFKGTTSPSLIGDYQFVPSGNSYFFTKLAAEAEDVFTVEVSHIDPSAATGLYNLSVGSALPGQTEQPRNVYLPLVTR